MRACVLDISTYLYRYYSVEKKKSDKSFERADGMPVYLSLSDSLRNTVEDNDSDLLSYETVERMLQHVMKLVSSYDDVFIAFDGGTDFKKERYQNVFPWETRSYKGNRSDTPEKLQTKEVVKFYDKILFYILKNVNKCYVAREKGYEADDIIYSLVRKIKNEYDYVDVYSNDSDLMFLVDDNVTFIAESYKSTKRVNKENFSTIKHAGIVSPYNRIILMKMLKGDSADLIPAVPIESMSMFTKGLDSVGVTERMFTDPKEPRMMSLVNMISDKIDEFTSPDSPGLIKGAYSIITPEIIEYSFLRAKLPYSPAKAIDLLKSGNLFETDFSDYQKINNILLERRMKENGRS